MRYGVVDRASNNVLGEYDTHAEAEEFLVDLVSHDPSATLRLAIVRSHDAPIEFEPGEWVEPGKWVGD